MMTAEQLEELPTLYSAHTDDLKIEAETMRVWLCRVSSVISVEILDSKAGKWTTTATYDKGGNPL